VVGLALLLHVLRVRRRPPLRRLRLHRRQSSACSSRWGNRVGNWGIRNFELEKNRTRMGRSRVEESGRVVEARSSIGSGLK
jgi:hypothetical protein